MADKEISDLPASGALTGAELLHVVQGGNSRKITLDEAFAASSRFALQEALTLASVTYSSSAYAAKGMIFSASTDLQVAGAMIKVGTGGGSVQYKIFVCRLNSSNVVTEVVASAAEAFATNDLTKLLRVAPMAISAGEKFAVIAVRTDSTSTTACTIQAATSPAQGVVCTYVGSVRYATLAPAVSDSVLFDATSSFGAHPLVIASV